MIRRILTVAVVTACGYAGMIAAPPAHATTRPPLIWMAKTADIARLNTWFGARTPAAPVPAFAWQLCGGPYNNPCPSPLLPGDVPVEASEGAIWAMASRGYAGKVMLDMEAGQPGHPWTPAIELANRLTWICRAARLERADPAMHVIIAPFDDAAAMRAEDVQAARCGAYAVGIQTQFASNDPRGKFQPYLTATIAAIRHVNRRILIGFGLSTNGPAGPANVWNEVRDYRYAVADGIQLIWWNIPDWQARSKCPAADRGCAAVDYRLWTDLGIGATS